MTAGGFLLLDAADLAATKRLPGVLQYQFAAQPVFTAGFVVNI